MGQFNSELTNTAYTQLKFITNSPNELNHHQLYLHKACADGNGCNTQFPMNLVDKSCFLNDGSSSYNAQDICLRIPPNIERVEKDVYYTTNIFNLFLGTDNSQDHLVHTVGFYGISILDIETTNGFVLASNSWIRPNHAKINVGIVPHSNPANHGVRLFRYGGSIRVDSLANQNAEIDNDKSWEQNITEMMGDIQVTPNANEAAVENWKRLKPLSLQEWENHWQMAEHDGP